MKLLILDGSSLLHRAFYALPLLSTSNGEFTNAVYGFANMLVKLLSDIKPDLVAAAFDKGRVTFRTDEYRGYKAQRKPTPSELVGQFALVQELLDALGIKTLQQEGYEADDIIGTFAERAGGQDFEVIIVTGDRDALQLINSNVTVMLTKKGISEMEMYDVERFKAEYGFMPRQLIDLKGLMGDSADNIPGVPGVGEKTGLKLIRQYGSVENVIQHAAEISGQKLKEKLIEHQELALLSKRLATIVCDMPIEINYDELKITPDYEKIEKIFLRLEFKGLLSRVTSVLNIKNSFADEKPVILQAETAADFKEFADKIKSTGMLYCFPVIGKTENRTVLNGLGLSDGQHSYYIDGQADDWTQAILLLETSEVGVITHDAKQLIIACRNIGIEHLNLSFDTLIAAYLLNPTAPNYELPDLYEIYTGKRVSFTAENTSGYACWAASVLPDLSSAVKIALDNKNLMVLYKDIEQPLIQVLADMEMTGIKIDLKHLEEINQQVSQGITRLLENIISYAGENFNVNSTKQLGHILFDKLKLPVIKKTKTGYSTDAEVLEKLVGKHPIIDDILQYRLLTKLKSTYLDGLKQVVNPQTGRIHTSFNQTVTATGRLSSSEPNLQNIPIRTEVGRKIRELFIPGDEWKYIMSADYSQIELRVLAHMSQDPLLLEAFIHEQDVHSKTAAEVFGVSMDEVTSELRAKAKAVNFGIIYGISDYGLSRDLNISRNEASQYIDSYFLRYHRVKEYIDTVVQQAHHTGYVTTMFGRVRYLPDINSSNFNKRSFAERTAMNTPIQGTAADIIKKAMIDVYRKLQSRKMKSRLLLQVHDELLLEVTADEKEEVSTIVKQCMEQTVSLSVPLLVDIKFGTNWADAK